MNNNNLPVPAATFLRLLLSYLKLQISFRFKRFFTTFKRSKHDRVIGYGSNIPGLNKRALIIYITDAFFRSKEDAIFRKHQNRWQAVEIANIFNQLGYVVDVVSLFDINYDSKEKYDVVFGVHPAFNKIAERMPKETLKIYYALELPYQHQNGTIEQRHRDLENRRGIKLKQRRVVMPHKSLNIADYVIYMGNDFSLDIYRKNGGIPSNFYGVPNTISNIKKPNLDDKNFEKARKRFLFLGSSGLILRGLDRLLEVFRDLPQYELYICTTLHWEIGLAFAYRKELFKTPNIHPVGWVDITSDTFKKIVNDCAYLIYPSGSEACSGSVLTGIGQGLIPIISRPCGIDVRMPGIILPDCEISTIKSAVCEAAAWSPSQCEKMAKIVFEMAKNVYSRDEFSKKMKKNLEDILSKRS